MIDEKLLTPVEKKWLNDYHAEVLAKTRGFFDQDHRTMNWLLRETEPI